MVNDKTGAIVEIGGDVSGLKAALEDGKDALNKFHTSTMKALDDLGDSFDEVGKLLEALDSKMGSLKFVLSIVGLEAAASMVQSTFNTVNRVVDDMASLGEKARRSGVSAEFYQEMSIQARKFGIEQEDVNGGLENFSKQLELIRKEDEGATKSVSSFSTSLVDQLKNTKNNDEALRLLSEALKNQTDEYKRAELAVSLLGKGNSELVDMLVGGRRAMELFGKSAHDAGQIISNEAIKSAQDLKKALDELANSPGIVVLKTFFVDLVKASAIALGSEAFTTQAQLENMIAGTTQMVEQMKKSREELSHAANNVVTQDSIKAIDVDLDARIKGFEDKITKWQARLDAMKGKSERDAARENVGAENKSSSSPEAPNLDAGAAYAAEVHKKMLSETQDYYGLIAFERDKDFERLKKYLDEGKIAQDDAAKARADIEARYLRQLQELRDKQIKPFTDAISSDLEHAFTDFVEKGKISWQELANSMLADISRIVLRMAVLQPLFGTGGSGTGLVGSGISSLMDMVGLKSALGNVFSSGEVIPFAKGGVIERPAIFGLRDGMGLMGEAGPEAILPLRRASDGSLGVQTTGGSQNITVNIQARDVESFRGSQSQIAAQLARAVRAGARNN